MKITQFNTVKIDNNINCERGKGGVWIPEPVGINSNDNDEVSVDKLVDKIKTEISQYKITENNDLVYNANVYKIDDNYYCLRFTNGNFYFFVSTI